MSIYYKRGEGTRAGEKYKKQVGVYVCGVWGRIRIPLMIKKLS